MVKFLRLRMPNLILALFILSYSSHLAAQCNVIASATPGLTLQCVNGTQNRSGLAWNPAKQLYYSVNAGSSGYTIETFSNTGVSLNSVTQGYDYRGLWWNTNTAQLEGNAYTAGVAYQNLNATTAYPLGSVTTIFTSTGQPDAQSVGKYDAVNNEIIYYYSGSVYRYSRATNVLINTLAITGLPVAVSNLNSNSIFYTGCTGKEYALYDYVLKSVYFINRATGTYVSTSVLPSTAPARSSFGASWARGLFWLFNSADLKWNSYNVLDGSLPLTLTGFTAMFEAKSVLLQWTSTNEVNTSKFIIERSTNGIDFNQIGQQAAIGRGDNKYKMADANLSVDGTLYYRLKVYDKDGSFTVSKIVTINLPDKNQQFICNPNPAYSYTNISFDSPVQGQLVVHSLAGAKIMTVLLASPTSIYRLPVQTLTDGVYIITVNDRNTILRQKLVIAR